MNRLHGIRVRLVQTCVREKIGDSKKVCLPGNSLLPERRAEFRYPTNDPVEVELFNCDFLHVPGVVLDVSTSELRVALQNRVSKGAQVKIYLDRQVVVYGEVRYCRPTNGCFHAGVLIQKMFYPRMSPDRHIDDDDLSLYVLWKGLTTREIIKLREHLEDCKTCRQRLKETTVLLNQVRLHQKTKEIRS